MNVRTAVMQHRKWRIFVLFIWVQQSQCGNTSNGWACFKRWKVFNVKKTCSRKLFTLVSDLWRAVNSQLDSHKNIQNLGQKHGQLYTSQTNWNKLEKKNKEEISYKFLWDNSPQLSIFVTVCWPKIKIIFFFRIFPGMRNVYCILNAKSHNLCGINPKRILFIKSFAIHLLEHNDYCLLSIFILMGKSISTEL